MSKKIFLLVFQFILLLFVSSDAVKATSVDSISPVTSGSIEKYAKFEVKFKISGSTYTNPFLPYDTVSFAQVPSGAGISVDGLFLAPNISNWNDAKKFPCFYFQPYDSNLVPVGQAEWRCRFTPEEIGSWQYKIKVTDKNGTIESSINQFTVTSSTRKGFVKVSTRDSKSFEFSDGSAFPWSLVTVNPIRGGNLSTVLSKMGQNGIKFVRWFPNREDGTVSVFSDNMGPTWGYGPAGMHTDYVDSEKGKKWSFNSYYYSAQSMYLQSGQKYKLSMRAFVMGDQVLRLNLANMPQTDICSSTNVGHTSCNSKKDGWNDYSITFTSNTTGYAKLYLHSLHFHSDAPSPYNTVKNGAIRMSDITLQKDETGSGGWGANMVHKGDPDTYLYMDQNEAATFDEVLRLSEQYGVYHKLTLFHKNDEVMNYLDKNGNLTDAYQCDWGYCPYNFYSVTGGFPRWVQTAYVRYFIARWGYSTALHSLEYVNESDLDSTALNPAFFFAKYIYENAPRKILYTNSFWGWWNSAFFADSTYGKYIDYGDKHWYSSTDSTNTELISNVWQDTVANIRQCYLRFKQYAAGDPVVYSKPIVRGETGVGISGTGPLHPQVKAEITGTYFHKKVWAHTGVLGYSCDGEWYPEIFEDTKPDPLRPTPTVFPNSIYDTYKIYSSYDTFISGEPLSNGTHADLGVDLSGTNKITSSNSTIRAYGSKDPVTTRVLVWVDNKNNTWQSANNSTTATSTLTIPGMPAGSYTQEVWDTRAATFTKTANAVTVGSDGNLSFSVTTAKDIAYKFYNPNTPTPISTPTVAISPTPSVSPTPSSNYDLNNDGLVDLKDIILVINYIFNTPSNPIQSYDVNKDGKIDLRDVIEIISYIFK